MGEKHFETSSLCCQPRRVIGARWGGWSSLPGRFTPEERPDTDGTGGWMGPRASLDGGGKSRYHRDSIPRPSSP